MIRPFTIRVWASQLERRFEPGPSGAEYETALTATRFQHPSLLGLRATDDNRAISGWGCAWASGPIRKGCVLGILSVMCPGGILPQLRHDGLRPFWKALLIAVIPAHHRRLPLLGPRALPAATNSAAVVKDTAGVDQFVNEGACDLDR